MDDQTNASRKAFADQKLLVDGIAEGVRILREKADDTNVRLSSMTQELESLRQIQSASLPTAPAAPTGDPSDCPADRDAAGHRRRSQQATGVSPEKAYDAAFNDYTGGQYDLAIEGFKFYLKTFPTSDRADDAQLNIGNSYYALGNFREAVTAFQRVISDLPADRQRARGVLQARSELRRAEAAGPGASRLRDGDQESPERDGRHTGQAAPRHSGRR